MWLPMKKRTRYISRVLMLLYIAAVCLLCFADIRTDIGVNSTLLGIPADKIVHFTMFLPFPALMYAAFHRQERKPARLIVFMLATLIAGTAAGAGIEIIQQMTGYRSCDMTDLLADFCGLAAAVLILQVFEAFVMNKRRAGK